jgi:tripartite-type tricarboxylate transporter receptor subunit TctC
MMNRLPAILALFASACAHAQTYPVKQMTMILPFAAGGPGDVIARNLGLATGKQLKQTIVVENVGGAGGQIAGLLREPNKILPQQNQAACAIGRISAAIFRPASRSACFKSNELCRLSQNCAVVLK